MAIIQKDETIVHRYPEFIVKKGRWLTHEDDEGTWVEWAESHDGGYVGDLRDANWFRLHGIVPQKRKPEMSVANIGYCAKEKKWYGWSHRALCGFEIGHEIKSGSVVADQFAPGFIAQTEDDCRALACAFAEAVS